MGLSQEIGVPQIPQGVRALDQRRVEPEIITATGTERVLAEVDAGANHHEIDPSIIEPTEQTRRELDRLRDEPSRRRRVGQGLLILGVNGVANCEWYAVRIIRSRAATELVNHPNVADLVVKGVDLY